VPKTATKFAQRAIIAVLVGYTSTGYILWHPQTGKFIETKNVDFNEKKEYREVLRDRAEVAVSEDWLLNFENEEPQDEVETQQQEKRGRGRPCKRQVNEEGKDEKKEEEIEVIPRKRVKPRKCKNKAKETSKAHTAEYVSP